MASVASSEVGRGVVQGEGELSAKAPEGLRYMVQQRVREESQDQAGLPVALAIGSAVALWGAVFAQGGNAPQEPVCARPSDFQRIKQPNGPVLVLNEPEQERVAAAANLRRPGCGKP